ncbi:hypothetical protein [Streptomyces sp. NPDC056632]|uniref:hypothetical protein n=1 Tax=Streptomyces sp. NPDC056632 TaxID=3345884 RepID=UPI0036777AC2
MRRATLSTSATFLLVPPERPYAFTAKGGRSPEALVIDLASRPAPDLVTVPVLDDPRRPYDVELWLRVHTVRSAACARDLAALGDLVDGLIIPGVRSVDDVDWVAERAPGTSLIPVVDSTLALLHAPSLARHDSVRRLGFTSLAASPELTDGMLTPDNSAAWVHRLMSAASLAAGLPGPVGGLYPGMCDRSALIREASLAIRSGFTGYCVTAPEVLPEVRGMLAAAV